MRVLVIVPEYPTAVSPGYQFVHDRVKEYQGHFDVDVFCCRSDQPEGYQHEGVSVLCGSTSRLIQLIRSGHYSARDRSALARVTNVAVTRSAVRRAGLRPEPDRRVCRCRPHGSGGERRSSSSGR